MVKKFSHSTFNRTAGAVAAAAALVLASGPSLFAQTADAADLFDAATTQLNTVSASVIAVLVIAIGIGAIYMVFRHVKRAMNKA